MDDSSYHAVVSSSKFDSSRLRTRLSGTQHLGRLNYYKNKDCRIAKVIFNLSLFSIDSIFDGEFVFFTKTLQPYVHYRPVAM
jgi:hypothetical protein